MKINKIVYSNSIDQKIHFTTDVFFDLQQLEFGDEGYNVEKITDFLIPNDPFG